MDQILHQLGGLLLGSVPTILLFVVLIILYRVLVYGALTRVLAERRARTEGAMEQAHDAIAAADAKAQEYEAKVRMARVEIFHAREQRLARWNRERESALSEAREAGHRRIAQAKAALDLDKDAARQAIQNSAEDLATEVMRAVVPVSMAVAGSSR